MTNKNTYNLLSQINIPADLRRLPIDKLPQVCEELRRDIIDELADNPGHFASSLGVVELTVALHYVYDTPYDRIVWDVGHQAYGHKILTERRGTFLDQQEAARAETFPLSFRKRIRHVHLRTCFQFHLRRFGHGGGFGQSG